MLRTESHKKLKEQKSGGKNNFRSFRRKGSWKKKELQHLLRVCKWLRPILPPEHRQTICTTPPFYYTLLLPIGLLLPHYKGTIKTLTHRIMTKTATKIALSRVHM